MSQNSIESTMTLEEAHLAKFDWVVLGAGVAGASFAIHAARQGKRVLLVDSQSFPREKVCGGCLNPRAQNHLERLGAMADLRTSGAIEIHDMHVHVPGHTSRWKVHMMMSVRRSTLDCILVIHAIRAGAEFLSETRGAIAPFDAQTAPMRHVRLTASNSNSEIISSVETRAIAVATGISRSSLPRGEAWDRTIANDSRIGVHCLVDRSRISKVADSESQSASWLESSRPCALHMVLGQDGYVGVCDTDGGFLDLAAAIDPSKIREHGGIGRFVASILNACNLELGVPLENESWQATPRMTHESLTVASNGVYLLGDSAGYVEPFTGEGMSWALAGAEALSKFTTGISGAGSGRQSEWDWTQWVVAHRHSKQSVSKWVARQARQIRRAKLLLSILDWIPPVRNALVRKAMR